MSLGGTAPHDAGTSSMRSGPQRLQPVDKSQVLASVVGLPSAIRSRIQASVRRGGRLEPLHPARKRLRRVGFTDQVKVISQDVELDDPEVHTMRGSDRPPDDPHDPAPPKGWHAIAHPEGDVQGETRRESLPTGMRHRLPPTRSPALTAPRGRRGMSPMPRRPRRAVEVPVRWTALRVAHTPTAPPGPSPWSVSGVEERRRDSAALSGEYESLPPFGMRPADGFGRTGVYLVGLDAP